MRNNKKHIVFIALTALAIMLIVGALYVALGSSETNKKEKVVVKENVKVITATDENLPLMDTDYRLIVYDEPSYEVGDILVSEITPNAPNGYIRRVINIVNEDYYYVLETEPALITDVFEEVYIKKTFLLTDEGAKDVSKESESTFKSGIQNVFKNLLIDTYYADETEGDKKYQFSVNFDYPVHEDVDAYGEIGFSVWLELELNIEDDRVFWSLCAHDEVGGDINLNCSSDDNFGRAEFKKVLYEKMLPNIQFFVGGIPVVVTNEIQAELNGVAHIGGEMETGVEVNSESRSGFQYDSETNQILEIKENDYFSDGMIWGTSVGANGKLSGGVYLTLISKLYDSTGGSISFGVEGNAEGDIWVGGKTDETDIYGGELELFVGPKMRGKIVVTVPLIDKKLTERTLFEAKLPVFWEKKLSFDDLPKIEIDEEADETINSNDNESVNGDVENSNDTDNNGDVQNEEIHKIEINFPTDDERYRENNGIINEVYRIDDSYMSYINCYELAVAICERTIEMNRHIDNHLGVANGVGDDQVELFEEYVDQIVNSMYTGEHFEPFTPLDTIEELQAEARFCIARDMDWWVGLPYGECYDVLLKYMEQGHPVIDSIDYIEVKKIESTKFDWYRATLQINIISDEVSYKVYLDPQTNIEYGEDDSIIVYDASFILDIERVSN